MRNNPAARPEEALSGVEQYAQQSALQAEAASGIGNDHVHRFGQLDLLGAALAEFDNVVEAVAGAQLTRQRQRPAHFDGVNLAGPGQAGQERKNAAAGSNVEHHIIFADDLAYGFLVGTGATGVGNQPVMEGQ